MHRCIAVRLEALEAANTSTSSNAGTDVDADDDVNDEASGKKRKRAAPTGSKSISSSSSSSSSCAAAKRAKSDHCTWTGKLCDAKQHFNECEYAGALCGFECGTFVRRMDKSEHEATICPNREVMCTNVGCTAVMPQPMIAAHKANDCPYEVVDCPFTSAGCNERVRRKDVNTHVDTATNQHMLLLLQDNRSLRQDNILLRQDNLSLQQKVAEQEEKLDGHEERLDGYEERLDIHDERLHEHGERLDGQQHQLVQHQLVHKVKLADLVPDGEVRMQSDDVVVGAYKASIGVDKGYDNNGDGCGVCLFLDDGPFPCRVTR